MRRWTRGLGLFVGCLLVVAGIAETVRAIRSGDGGLWFWTPTLVGGGALVLAGAVVQRRSARLAAGLTCTGCLAALLPTMWTVLGPMLLITLAVLSLAVAGQEEQP